jgi:hypothetical protein
MTRIHPKEQSQAVVSANDDDLPTLSEFQIATKCYDGEYVHGCNISWLPSSSSNSICFGVYIADFPAELARLLSDECYLQLPRKPLITIEKHKPAVDLSQVREEKRGSLVFGESMWHPANALEWLFEWFARVAEGDRSLPKPPDGVYSRFHPVDLINWLKLLDVALFLGSHGWFVRTLEDQIKRCATQVLAGRAAAKDLKQTLQQLDDIARVDLIRTVAGALACGRLDRTPSMFGVDATLGDEIAAEVAKRRGMQRSGPALILRKEAIVEVSSSDVDTDTASESGSTGKDGLKSSQTGIVSSPGEEEAQTETEKETFGEDSMLGWNAQRPANTF